MKQTLFHCYYFTILRLINGALNASCGLVILLISLLLNYDGFHFLQLVVMAAAATADQKSVTEETVQCMIFLEYEEFLKCDTKLLPCSHVLCTECLFNIHTVSIRIHPCQICR